MAYNLHFGFIAVNIGTADAIAATFSPALTALTDKDIVWVVTSDANTITTPTFAPNGLVAKTIVKTGGDALLVGDIAAGGHVICLVYSASSDKWELLDPAGFLAANLTGLFNAVMALVLTGFAAGANTAIAPTDTLAQALAKIQGQINARATTSDLTNAVANKPEFFGMAMSDETTVLAAASTVTPFATMHVPYAMTLTQVFAGLRTAGTGAAVVTVDIHLNGTTIMNTTKILFTAGVKLSANGTLTTTAVAVGDYLEFFLDVRDTNNVATGLKAYIVGHQ